MFGLYWFFLRTEKLFLFNRFFLNLALIISLILPFISISVNFQPSGGLEEVVAAINRNIQSLSTPQVTLDQDQNIIQDMLPHQLPDEIQPPSVNYSNIFLILYICGMLVLFLRFLNNMYLLLRQVRSNEKIRYKGSRIVLVRERINPYCFFNTIFLSREDYENGTIDQALINHEMKHISQYHSVDIVILELIRIIYWFNPILILYSSAIRENHEYLADRGAVIDDIKSYSEKLLKSAFGNIPITSGFNRSLTRKRLMMITSPESGRIRLGLKISLTSSLLALFFLLLSFKQAERQSAEMIFVPYENISGTVKDPETGRASANVKTIQQQTTANDTFEVIIKVQKAKSIKGTVLREDGIPLPKVFVNVSTELVRSVTDKEGRFEIKDVPENSYLVFASPGYTPKIVKSEFDTEMMVIMAKEPDKMALNKPAKILSSSKTKPLIIVDGVIKTDSELPDANLIKTITVLKSQAAVSAYGDKGANGVIIVVTRDYVEKNKGLSKTRTMRGYLPMNLPHPVDLPLPEF